MISILLLRELIVLGQFRRNSIIRASGHTFEYVGYENLDYSALPEKQDRVKA